MTFTLCRNGCCDRAGWCKRITYPVTPDKEPERIFLSCGPDNNYKYYVRNKAREIYERDNPNQAFSQDDEPIQGEHPNNNRESGLREDNAVNSETELFIQSWGAVEQDRLLQLQCSSDRRSDITSADISNYFEELVRNLCRYSHEEGHVVLPNVTLDGISAARSGNGQPDDGRADTGLQPSD